MLRELIEPTWVLDVMIEQVIRPRFDELVAIVRDLLPAGASDLGVRLCAESILAQCVHVIHARTVVGRLLPELKYTLDGVEKIADHITAFSLAAIRNLPLEESSE